jgi:cellulose synthase/poly-beta-1,6-N-acetylglucosamine synthase-like glycosyltransferase
MREISGHWERSPGTPRRDWHAGVARPAIRERTAPPPVPANAAAFEALVDRALLETAARRADALGVGVDEVLRCHGILPPEQIAWALSDHLGLPLDPLNDDFSTARLDLVRAGVFARSGRNQKRLVTVAPRGEGVHRLADALASNPRLARHVRMVSPERLSAHVRKVCAGELAREAVYGLRKRSPDLSAIGYGGRQLRWFTVLFSAAVIATGLLAPDRLLVAVEYFLALSFLSWMLLRLLVCTVRVARKSAREIPDRMLPIYTIIVPLYREAAVVPNLIAALRRLDYPREKLDIKLVLEEDDFETRAAVAELGITAPFEVIAPTRAGPRTKPKALASALPFARGSFVVVFDAEDEPEPDQLRKALAAFAEGPDELACVQARLAIDNAADGWLSRHFTAEYAGQFDVFLPALAGLRLPLPLGGTSNHFRAEVLRRVGGWDPFNVTEDADLGMRLARFGYRTGVIDSTTWEEAPVTYRQWIGQRSRWFKGWMQTWIVHMRYPLRLWRELGFGGFLALQLLVGGTVLSALVHPFFLLQVVADACSGALFAPGESVEEAIRKGLALATLLTGYFGSILFGLFGLAHRRMLSSAWVLVTIPFYWLLLSLAAWRALRKLITDPHRWEKTEHGLARSSRRTERRGTVRRSVDGRRVRH